MNNKMKLWLIIPVCAIVLLLGGTYAWYVWQTTQGEETIIATDVGYAKVFFDGGSDVSGKLKPVSDKSKGMSKTITVSADKGFIEDITFNLYLDINSIDAGLKHESFKFELYKDGQFVTGGNFSDTYLTSALSECQTNEGVSHIILTSDIVTTEESVYTLYTWIDGNMENPLEMEGKNFDFTLHASGQHAILGETPIIPEGATYIRGAIPGTPTRHDMTNAIVYNAGDHFPASPQVGDIYQYDECEYVYGYYVEYANGYPSTSGISNSTDDISVSNLAIANNYTYNEQNNAQFIWILGGYNVVWKPAEGRYEDTEGWGVALKNYAELGLIGDFEMLATINGADVINVSGTFSDTYHAGVNIVIPETVKYADYTFYNADSWGEFSLTIEINSTKVISAKGIGAYGNVIVPANSTTYNTLMNEVNDARILISYKGGNVSTDSLVHNDIIPKGGFYTSGSVTYTEGQSFPETSADGDYYQFGDYIYVYDVYYGGWTLITLDIAKESYGPILKTINNVNVSRLDYAFYGLKKLVTAPEIPDSVTNMWQMFKDCQNLTGTIRINSRNISDIYGVFDGTVKPITVEVPANSTTYYTFMNAPFVGADLPENVTITTFIKE